MRKQIFNAPALKTLAIVTALTAAPVAFAQDSSTTSWTQRFNATIGYAQSIPKSDPGTVAGSDAHMDGSGAATLSGSWFFNDSWAIELWGTPDKFEQKVSLANGGRGTVKQQPVALSGQYFFGHPSQPIRPYVGLGYYQANIDDESFDSTVAGGQHVGFGSPDGAIATVGTDFNINDRWFARADARYLWGSSDVSIAGQGTGESLQLDPWVVGVGVGARF